MRSTETLISATRALEAGEDSKALRLLLGLWPTHRDAQLADAIERLTPAAGWPQLAGLRAPDAARALAELREPSPVVGRWLLRLLERALHNPDRGAHLTSHAFWLAVARQLPVHAHAGIRDRIVQVAGELHFTALVRSDVHTALAAAIREVATIATPSPLPELAALVAILDRRAGVARARGATGDELVAAIREAPDDDAPRTVYADWLAERGDPYGELIALQLARHRRNARVTQHERALVESLMPRILGALAPVVRMHGLRVERGFVQACHVHASRAQVIEELRGADEWATVEELVLDNDFHGIVPDRLPALRRLAGLNRALAAALADPARWSHLAQLGAWLDRPVLETAGAPPALRSLDALGSYVQAVNPAELRWLWTTAIGNRLAAFEIGSAPASLGPWLAEDAAHRLPVQTLVIWSTRWSNTGPGWKLELRRDEHGALSRLVAWRGAYRVHVQDDALAEPLDELCAALQRVPAGVLRTVEVLPSRSLEPTAAARTRLDALCHRLGIAELVCP